jgi:hypothetical protein
MMAAAGMRERPALSADRGRGYAEIVAELFEPDLGRLAVPADRIAPFLRALSFVTSIGPFQASAPIEIDELVELALHGIAGRVPTAADDRRSA